MIIDCASLSPTSAYHLITQTVIPRPIAWVLTQNADAFSHNLAPYSYFNAISADPPLLLFSCAPKADGGIKDTVTNTLREKRLVIHIASETQLQPVQDSAKPLDYGDSEVSALGLGLCDFGDTGLKRLTDAPIAFACKLYKNEQIGNAPQTLIFAEIESVTQEGRRITVDATCIAPLARLGLNQFSNLGETLVSKQS